MDLSEKEIILKIKQGEIDYFAFIVKKYSTLIYRHIGTKLKKKEDIEDLVQNVFISFYKSIDNFDHAKPIKPYLYQIVKNELKMFYRSRKPTLSLKEEIVIETKDESVFVEEDLEVLNGEEKQMLLKIGEGYSYEEIAKKFKKPLNTVKSIIRRARIKTKRNYEKT